MIKNFDSPIFLESGEPDTHKDGKPIIALDIVKVSLFVQFEGEIDGEEKFKRYELVQRLKNGGDNEVSPEEIVILKQRIGKIYPANIIGQLWKILNS